MKLQDFESSNVIKIYFSNKGNQAVLLYRLSQWLLKHKMKLLSIFVRNRNIALTGADIDPASEIGSGLKIGHPVGVVISGKVKAGRNLFVQSCVTIGTKDHSKWDSNVVIEDNVEIGTGAKVLGNINIAEGTKVGANAVCLISIFEKGKTVVGVPAHIVESNRGG